jgi:hypothetical protein
MALIFPRNFSIVSIANFQARSAYSAIMFSCLGLRKELRLSKGVVFMPIPENPTGFCNIFYDNQGENYGRHPEPQRKTDKTRRRFARSFAGTKLPRQRSAGTDRAD